MKFRTLLPLIILSLALTACNGVYVTFSSSPTPLATLTEPPMQPSDTAVPSETPEATETAMPIETATEIPTDTATATLIALLQPSATADITATPAILGGIVIPDLGSCRRGPGAMYLFEFELTGGWYMEIVGRNPDGSWVIIRARGSDSECWVKTDLMAFEGDVMSVEEVDIHRNMAWSPFYGPLTGVTASRISETEVQVSWNPLIIDKGDEHSQTPYIVEAWVCRDGELVFVPTGSWTTSAVIVDEPGCSEDSWGQAMRAEKHGYTAPVQIVWP